MSNEIAELNKRVVMRFNTEFIEKNDFFVFHEIIADDFINHTALPGNPKGPEGMLGYMNLFHSAFSNVRVVFFDLIAENDKVASRKAIEGIHTGPFMGIAATGKYISLTIFDIIRLENGKYVEHWAMRDIPSLLQHLKEK